MKRALLLLLALSGWGWAEQCQITSPLPVPVTINGCTFSGSLPNNSTSYIQNTLAPTTTTQMFNVQTATITGNATLGYLTGTQCLQEVNGAVSGTGSACGAGGGGGGSSSLAVGYGTPSGFLVQTSSPTGNENFDQTRFLTSLTGSATAFITISESTQAVTAAYTVSATTSNVVMANCASACTVTLPTAVGVSGRIYRVKVLGTGIVTIATTSSQTIDGSTTISPNPNQFADMEMVSDGSNWEIL